MGALNVIVRKIVRNFIKKYDSYARLRPSTELLNLYCMEAEE